ncbi:MAG: hypothetical protein HRT89_19315 [Lentisphaeria bacterium]|nr:DUF6259 domain-containing protein [Lentisphaeria bacterium]NQZ70208.1 hypothetical protein [Lentisphaeria bacterium]
MNFENEYYIIEIDDKHGRIERLYDKAGDVELITEPRLAENFRLLLPLPDLEGNYICGKDQNLSSHSEEGNTLTLNWDGPLQSERGEAFNVSVSMRISFVGTGIEINTTVDNQSEQELAEVWYAIIGGHNGVGERLETQAMIPQSGARFMTGETLYTDFSGFFYGSPLPEKHFAYPGQMAMSWADFYNPSLNRGFYLGCHDTVDRSKILRMELYPGIGNGRKDKWPKKDDVDGLPIGMQLHWMNMPYSQAGESYECPVVRIEAHDGDWHEAAPIYREWFTSEFTLNNPADDWIRHELAFQWIILMLPEGQIRWQYKDIPKLAQDALDSGVKALLISGFDVGGHDSHYPYYEPDPRLGNWDDLEKAVAEAKALGIKIFFFVNLNVVDPTTDWYKDELHKYVSRNRWGQANTMGWGMGTVGAKADYHSRPNMYVNPYIKEVRDAMVKQYVKFAEIGADGIHIDKLAWTNSQNALSFNPLVDASPDSGTWKGIMLAMKESFEACLAVNPDFGISVEGPWDRLLEYSNVSWLWSGVADPDLSSPIKYTFPQWLPAQHLVQPFDYLGVNNSVRHGYQLFMGPGQFAESMGDPKMKKLSAYIKEVIRIWEPHKDILFMGEYLDDREVTVEAHETIRWGTHRDPKTGKRGAVLMNFDDCPHEAEFSFDGNESGDLSIYAPFADMDTASGTVKLTIAPERLVIIIEN